MTEVCRVEFANLISLMTNMGGARAGQRRTNFACGQDTGKFQTCLQVEPDRNVRWRSEMDFDCSSALHGVRLSDGGRADSRLKPRDFRGKTS